MDVDFELSRPDRFRGLLMNVKDLSKSNTYYHQIHPTEAAEVDARLNTKPGVPTAAPATPAKPA